MRQAALMKRLLILALILHSFQSNGQKLRFTDANNHWFVKMSGGGTPQDYYICRSKYSYSGDTIIQNKTYKILFDTTRTLSGPAAFNYFIWNQISCFIREDTLLNKVFMRFSNGMPGYLDTSEVVLYDYNLQLGDTFNITYSNNPKHFCCNVVQIDSILINNTYHRKWRLNILHAVSSQTSTPYYDVIEGVGCLHSPWFPIYPVTFENNWTLYCFSNNTITQSSVSIVNSYSACDSIVLVGVNDLPINQRIGVFPNPIEANSKITFPDYLTGILRITDITGKIVVADKLNNKKEISIGKYPLNGGIYYFTVSVEKRDKVYKGKFLVQ
jgi:hypothetical protein